MHACMHAWMHAHTYSYVSSVPRAPILAVSLQSPTNHIAPLIALSHRIASSHRFIARFIATISNHLTSCLRRREICSQTSAFYPRVPRNWCSLPLRPMRAS